MLFPIQREIGVRAAINEIIENPSRRQPHAALSTLPLLFTENSARMYEYAKANIPTKKASPITRTRVF